MATSTFLQITDGTTDIVIGDGTNPGSDYQLAFGQWAPRVARFRKSQLGGRGQYDDVSEEMVLNIYGTDAADCLANLGALSALLDQADRWSYGESVDIVSVEYSPAGATASSTGSPLKAVIVGRAFDDNDSDALLLPGNVEQVKNRSAILDVAVRFKRRGQWLHTEEAESSSAEVNGDLATSSAFSAVPDILSPTEVSITGLNAGPNIGQVFIVVTDVLKGIIIVVAETSWATGAPYTSVNESANNARNTNVVRYTPTGTTEVEPSGFLSLGSAANTNSKRFAVFANVRNNSSTTSFTIRIFIRSSTSDEEHYTNRVVVPPFVGSVACAWISLGAVTIDTPPADGVGLAIQASAASGSIDIDTALIVDQDEGHAYVVEINESVNAFVTDSHSIDHRILTDITPVVLNTQSSVDIPRSYYGDPSIHTDGSVLEAIVLGTGKTTDADQWRQIDSGNALISNTFTFTRTRAYLAPV